MEIGKERNREADKNMGRKQKGREGKEQREKRLDRERESCYGRGREGTRVGKEGTRN